jgi:hypothetical protein
MHLLRRWDGRNEGDGQQLGRSGDGGWGGWGGSGEREGKFET